MTEPIASSKCLVCGKDTPHVHNLTEQGQYTKIQRLNSQIRELQRENESLQAERARLNDFVHKIANEYFPYSEEAVRAADILIAELSESSDQWLHEKLVEMLGEPILYGFEDMNGEFYGLSTRGGAGQIPLFALPKKD